MSELEALSKAIAIATEAHYGQGDRAGKLYILHPLRVMLTMATEHERIVAVLHDVVEDCAEWPLEELAKHFPGTITEAIDALTRRPGEPYDAYIGRASRNDIARRVKLADLRDNMDLTRIGPENMTEADWARHLKYGRAAAALMALNN